MRSFLSVKTIKAFTGEMTIGDGVVSVAGSVFPIQDVVSIIDGTAYIRVTCVLGEITQAGVSKEGLPVYLLNTGVQVVAVDPSAHVVSQIHDTLLNEITQPVTITSEKPVSVSGQVAETETKAKAEEQKPKAKRTRRPRKKVEAVEQPVQPVQTVEAAKPTEEPTLDVEKPKEIPSTYTALGAGVVAAAVAHTTIAEAKDDLNAPEPSETTETVQAPQAPEESFSLEPNDEDAGIDDELPAPVEDHEIIAKAEAAVAKAEAEDTDSLDLPIAEDDRSDFEPLDGFDTLDKVDTNYNAATLFENGLPDDDSVDPNDALAPAHRADDTDGEEESLEVEDEDLVEDRYEVDDDDDLYNFDDEDN